MLSLLKDIVYIVHGSAQINVDHGTWIYPGFYFGVNQFNYACLNEMIYFSTLDGLQEKCQHKDLKYVENIKY